MGDPVGAGSPRGVEPLDLEGNVPEAEHPVEFLVLHWWMTFDYAAVAVAGRPLASVRPMIAARSTAAASARSCAGSRALGQLAADTDPPRWAARTIETGSVTAEREAAWRIRVEEI